MSFILQGITPVNGGGTGSTSLPLNNVLLGNGTSPLQAVAPGASGNVLSSNGTTWLSTTPSASAITRSARTSNTILTGADSSTLIDITSGTFSQTFTAAATLGNGWFCYIYNSGTGLITLDPNASETIDGLTSYIMYPGESRLITCSGTAFNTMVLQPFTYTTDSSVTFTTPPGYKTFSGYLWAGGGSGGANTSRSGGGGGGACVPFYFTSAAAGASQTITIGAGGLSVASASVGNVGGNSSIGSLVTAYGGGGGGITIGCGGGGGGAISAGASGSNTLNAGGRPVAYSNGVSTSFSNMGLGGGSAQDASVAPGAAGDSGYGGGAGGTVSNAGGSSVYGGGGGAGSDNGGGFYGGGTSKYGGNGGTNNNAGTVPSGGGSAGTAGTSGAGAAGRCTITGGLS